MHCIRVHYHTTQNKKAIGAEWSEVEAEKFDGVASKLNYELVGKPFYGQGAKPQMKLQRKGKKRSQQGP